MSAKYFYIDNIKWYLYHGVLIPDTVPHQNIILSKEHAFKLLKKSGAYFIYWTSDFDSSIKYPFWYVIKDEKEDLSKYSSKMRTKIRKGLKNCKVELVEALNEDLIKSLYDVYLNAFRRYKKIYVRIVSFSEFRKGMIRAFSRNERDLWVVRERKENIPIAYSWFVKKSRVAEYSSTKYHPDFLRLRPSYALTFEVNRYYLNELNFLYIHDGAKNLGHETEIHDWLIHNFRFRKAHCRLHVLYSAGIRLLVDFLMPYYKFFEEINSRLDNRYLMKLLILLRHEVVVRESERLENIAKWK